MAHQYKNEHEVERAKFNLWCGMEPIHDSTGQRVGWRMPESAERFLRMVWIDGESPFMRWKRLGMP